MKVTFALVFLLLNAIVGTQAHLWLRTPLSRGGVNNIGGTGGPCAGLAAGSGTRTTYEAGQSVTFQFRANQHGPAPFQFALSTAGETYTTILKSNIANTVTAGPDSFNGVNVQVTLPTTLCETCSIQLSGMGQTDGSGKWYNCADIKIVAAGSLTGPRPSTVAPTTGPNTGGTTVTVTGTNFGTATSSTIKCAFGQTTVPATWVSATSVTCVSPAYNEPTSVAVEVALDGTHFSATGTEFTYTGTTILPEIDSISPKSGPTGTVITISGQNFYASAAQCKFGTTVVAATVTSDSTLQCTVPTLSADQSSVALEVNIDGSPYSSSGTVFKVKAASSSSGMSSGQAAGIAIGVILIVGIVAAVGVLMYLGKIKVSKDATPSAWQKGRV